MVQGLTEPLFQNFFQKKVWQRDYDNMKKQCGAKLHKMCINDLTSVEFRCVESAGNRLKKEGQFTFGLARCIIHG